MTAENNNVVLLEEEEEEENNNTTKTVVVANIAVIGCGWWSQGWHLPVLHNNPKCHLVAIVDSSLHPTSKLNPNLSSLKELSQMYHPTAVFTSVQELLQSDLGPQLDGVLVATPHATHYTIGQELFQEMERRRNEESNSSKSKPLHILMEKPMTTDVDDAINLYRLVKKWTVVPPSSSDNDETKIREGTTKTNHSVRFGQFWINHTANYRSQCAIARDTIVTGKLGQIRHVTASFAAPLTWIFNDVGNDGWNTPTGNMIGNGFAWGQSSHLLAFLFHIIPFCVPQTVYCRMVSSKETGADIAHSATIECWDMSTGTPTQDKEEEEPEKNHDKNIVLINMSGTALLPGHQYSDPPIAKLITIDVYGDDGSLHYGGNDLDPTSGRLEYRSSTNGTIQVLCDRFEFEAYDNLTYGPESIQAFVELCCEDTTGTTTTTPIGIGANVVDGLRSVQVIDAMYRSNASKQVVHVVEVKTEE